MGAMTSMMAPPTTPSALPRSGLGAVTGGRGLAPVVAVLVVSAKRQTSPSLPPKGADPRTLRHFPCKTDVFKGPLEGAMIAIVDP